MLKLKQYWMGLGMAAATFSAYASEYGCKVLLCLANPNGPRAVAECDPPITKLYRDLAKGKPFPRCDLAEGPNGKSYARKGYSYYDPCPEGTRELGEGAYAIQASTVPQYGYAQEYRGEVYAGIGSGDWLQPGSGDGYSPLPAKVCVSEKVGRTVVMQGSGDSTKNYSVDVYERVVVMDPQGSQRIIDVFIDDKLYRRVRW